MEIGTLFERNGRKVKLTDKRIDASIMSGLRVQIVYEEAA